MKYYKDPSNNEVYAYEADGSQDEYIKPELVAIDDAEAQQLIDAKHAAFLAEHPAPTDPVDKLRAFLAANPDVAKILSAG